MVGIIALLAAAAVPNIMKATQDQPLLRAVHVVKDIFIHAKHRATNDRNAYAVQLSEAGDPELGGLLEVYRGDGPHCGGVDIANSTPTRSVEVNTYLEDHGAETGVPGVRVTSSFPQAPFAICFTPDGRMLDMATRQPLGSPVGATGVVGEAVITLQVFLDGAPASSRHNILVPYSGKPRVLFGDLDEADGEGGA